MRYETLDEAMQKVRDLALADKLDAPENGTMFVRYAIELDPPLHVEHDDVEAQDDNDADGRDGVLGGPRIFRLGS